MLAYGEVFTETHADVGIGNPKPSLPGLVCMDDKVGFGDREHIHSGMEHVRAGEPCVEARALLKLQQELHG